MNKDLETGIKSLPPLPESVGKIQAICNNPDAGIGEISAVVEKDPMLTANLLKAANSPLYGFSREINNITQAVSLFGMATVKGFALASAVRTTMKIDLAPYGLSTDSFASTSQMHNALMMNWYKKVNNSMMEVLSPASFLLGVGKIVISNRLIEDGKKDEFLGKIKEAKSLSEVENEFFGVDSADVAAAVFDHWRFEPDLVEAIKYSNEPAKADDDIKDYAFALNVVKTAAPFHGGLTEKTVNQAIKLLLKNRFDEELFKSAIDKLQNS